MSAKSYDQKSLDLALAFLSDFPALTADQRKDYAHRMALDIQGAIEDFIFCEDIEDENSVQTSHGKGSGS